MASACCVMRCANHADPMQQTQVADGVVGGVSGWALEGDDGALCFRARPLPGVGSGMSP